MKRVIIFVTALCLAGIFLSIPAYCEEDILSYVKKKNIELTEKEKAIKRQEVRLNAIMRDLDAKINKYESLLNEIKNEISKLEAIKNERIDHLIKTYEAMPADKAAQQLSQLDEQLAIKILLGMKNKKAAAIMASMDTVKANALAKGMANPVKKFPVR